MMAPGWYGTGANPERQLKVEAVRDTFEFLDHRQLPICSGCSRPLKDYAYVSRVTINGSSRFLHTQLADCLVRFLTIYLYGEEGIYVKGRWEPLEEPEEDEAEPLPPLPEGYHPVA